MNWKPHLAIGIILTAIVFYFLGTGLVGLVIFSLFGGLCALVPDLDHDSSKGRKILDLVAILFALVLAYFINGFGLAMLLTFLVISGAYFVIFKLFKPKHRGITHTIFACFVFAIGLFLLAGKEIAMAGFVGYLSHLLADNQIKFI